MRTKLSSITILLLASFSAIWSQNLMPPSIDSIPTKSAAPSANSFDVVKEEHTLALKDKILCYDSLTGMLTLKADDGKDKAHIFFTAYFVKNTQAKDRPITFCFNGGPGSASIWLHMGAIGPKKVIIKDLGPNLPPGHYEDNLYTLLDRSDLVFVDPVSTGFSQAADGIDPKQFYGVEEDISCMAEFIRHFVTQYDRWGSSKFLLGESYGTLRVVGLADKLYEEYFMNINGLVLISSCLDLQVSGFDPNNELGYVYSLPSFAAAAWYHKKLQPELQSKKLQELLKEVEEFAIHDYATALLIGDILPDEKKQEIATKIANYTGLTPKYVLQSALRIRDNRYLKELLRGEHKVLGRFDGRYVGFDLDQVSDVSGYDPSIDSVAGNFTSAFLQYVNEELGWKKDQPYRVLTSIVHPWNWGLKNQPAGMGYLSVSDHLRSAMIKNPALKVFMAGGYFDLATPYFATDYTVDHLHLAPPLRANVERYYYEAGHMMYLRPSALIQLKKDLSQFIEGSTKRP